MQNPSKPTGKFLLILSGINGNIETGECVKYPRSGFSYQPIWSADEGGMN